MEDKYIGAIDQGTTSTRFFIFDANGNIVSMHQLEHRQIFPKPGWVEHDPMEIVEKTESVIRHAMVKAGITGDRIAALGVTNQRETTVVWDPETGKPYHNAIVWQDTRTSEICAALSADAGKDRFRNKVGLPLATYFSGPKIKWLMDEVPGVKNAAINGRALFGTMDTWLIWWLTGGPRNGVHVTDVTNAGRTMLMGLESLAWDPEMLETFKIPEKMLPAIRSSSEVYGYTPKDGVFGASIPVSGDLGDQQAALFGQTCFSPGEAKNTYGTGCFMLLNTGGKPVTSRHGLLTTVAYQIGDGDPVYALEGSIAIAGSLVQWFRDNLGMIRTSDEIESLARSVDDNGGIYFVPAFSGLFAPHWKTEARGVITGLTHYINKGHFARAVLESCAYQAKEIFVAMENDSGVPLKSLKVDGGMTRNDLLMQFQADILDIPVIRPKNKETSVLGAAYAAGLAVGFWRDTDELSRHWAIDKRWDPMMDQDTRNRLFAGWLKAVEKSYN